MKTNEGERDRVEFKPPKGFVPPEASETGEFDLVCTFRSKPNGDICLTQLGDTKMPGYGEEGESRQQAKPSYSEYAKGMQSMMPQGGAPAPGG